MPDQSGSGPNEMPAAEGSTSQAATEQGGANTGHRTGSSRTPMVLGLGVMGTVIAVMVLAMIVGLVVTLTR